MIKHEILPNGDLLITADDDSRAELGQAFQAGGYMAAESLVIEAFQPNGELYLVEPEWISALTDAPILADDITFDDDGTPTVCGRIWWFPDYQITDPWECLRSTGRVVFSAAN